MTFQRQIIPLALVLFAGSLSVAGCIKVGPDFTKPEAAISSNWLETTDERVKSEPANYRAWWETFDDQSSEPRNRQGLS